MAAGTAVVTMGVDEGVSVAATTDSGVGLGPAVGAASPPQDRARKAVKASRTAMTDSLTESKLVDTATVPSRCFTEEKCI